MAEINHVKRDYVGLSSETKPTDAVNGEVYIEVDTKKIFIFYAGTWYEQ